MEHISVTPMISIRPNRLSVTQLVRRTQLGQFFKKPENVQILTISNLSQDVTSDVKKKVLEKKFHNFSISVNSQRNLKDKISYLFQFAKSRRIKTYNGKVIPNFKVCFLTLTLPATQKHCTSEISKELLDTFLQVLRQRLGMQNYVWRLEFQSNGNVHYHIATDVYIDYYFARKHWNNICEKLGYVSDYQKSMQKLSYTDYCKKYNSAGNIPADVLYKRWVRGKSEKWRNPNSVDVKNAKSSDNIAWYISKYFSKSEKGAKCNALDNEENSFALRLCFWSRSLSRCKSESMPFDYYAYDLIKIFENCEEVLRVCYDYCRVYYFSFSRLPARVKSIIGAFFNEMRAEINYLPAP